MIPDEEESIHDQLIQELEDKASFSPYSNNSVTYTNVMPFVASSCPLPTQQSPKAPEVQWKSESAWTKFLLDERDRIVQGMKLRWTK